MTTRILCGKGNRTRRSQKASCRATTSRRPPTRYERSHTRKVNLCIIQVYRDAYNRKVNDKYLPKWKEYKELASWASDLLFQTGIGITSCPVARPQQPALDWVSSTVGGMALFVRITWVGTKGVEGSGSLEKAIAIPSGNALRVTPPTSPAGVTGWNVYVGESSGVAVRQGSEPLELGAAWVMPGTGLTDGEPIQDGQPPEVFKTVPRFLQRG